MSKRKDITKRFDRILQMMASQAESAKSPGVGNRASDKARVASYGDARIRGGKSASASSTSKRKSP